MPELPEAETIAAALDAALRGARIVRAGLLRRDFLKTGSPSGLRRLAGGRIAAAGRRGKCVVLEIPPRRLVLQLGMAGRVYVHRPPQPRPPHTHLLVALADGREMRYANVRRIAAGVHLLAAGQAGPLGRLGPDADKIGREEFVRRIAARRTCIKTALLNQSILAGVGNIYAQEALFRAGIRPARRANRTSAARLARLHRALRAVLAEAIAAGGSTVTRSTPFAGLAGELGYFTAAHRVYGRYGRPCRRCRATLRRTTIAGRTTTYCPRCQK